MNATKRAEHRSRTTCSKGAAINAPLVRCLLYQYWRYLKGVGRRPSDVWQVRVIRFREFLADAESGELQLVIREGDLVETKLGVFEPIDLDNLHSELSGFNDQGEVLFTAHDGVYIATLSPVPEPATVVIALIGGFVLTWIHIRARASHHN
jgi:hypothetical protein